jgi:hypothetical protein
MARLAWLSHDRGPAFSFPEETLDLADDAGERRPPQHCTNVIGIDLDRSINFVLEAARRACRNDPVSP